MDITNTRADSLMHAAIGGLSARQRVISDNVANVDTPDFKASRVHFERTLLRAIDRIDPADGGSSNLKMAKVMNSVAGPDDVPATIEPELVQLSQTTHRFDGNNVDIDQEMIDLAQTNITYNALIALTSSRMQMLRTIINDGRR